MLNSMAMVFALGAMLFWSVGDFLIHRTSKKVNNFQALIYINLTGSIILLPFAVKYFSQLNFSNILPLIALSLVDLAFGLILLRAYEQGKLSVIDVILTMELPLTVLFGLLFFHESLTYLQTILILIIVCGIFFVSKETKTFYQKIICFIFRKNRFLESGAVLALLAAFVSSFYNFFIALNSRNVSPFLTIWLPWTISLVILLLYFYLHNGFKKGLKILVDDIRKYKKIIISGAVIDASAWTFYAIAVSKQELAIVTAITESYPALAMFYGVKFNKEKISKIQYIGAALALGGSLIIALIS
jgi:drug/metabolite transporter (DMT)-like permease